MPKIRVAEDENTYYVGIEPPLEANHFARLPSPYKRYASAETAGWPASAILSRAHASEIVIGLHKESLLLAALHDCANIDALEGLENCAANRLIYFLGAVAQQVKDTQIDARRYELAYDGQTISFI